MGYATILALPPSLHQEGGDILSLEVEVSLKDSPALSQVTIHALQVCNALLPEARPRVTINSLINRRCEMQSQRTMTLERYQQVKIHLIRTMLYPNQSSFIDKASGMEVERRMPDLKDWRTFPLHLDSENKVHINVTNGQILRQTGSKDMPAFAGKLYLSYYCSL